MKNSICWNCGGEATVTRDLREKDTNLISCPKPNEHQRCYCEKCFKEMKETLEQENETFLLLKRKRMFETAVRNLERQGLDFVEYREAIKTIEQYNIENDGKFDSSYEIIAAIILIYNHIQIKPQFKVGKYQVDFLLPNEKIVLEIDGDRHSTETIKIKDTWRDVEIKRALGDDWEVLRVSTVCLDTKAERLVKAMDKILDYRLEKRIAWNS